MKPEPKILDARSQSLKFEYWLHKPEKSTDWQRMSKLFTKQPMNWQKSRRFKSLGTITQSNNQVIPGNQRAALSLTRSRILTLTQQWQYLNFSRNSFYILSPASGVIGCRELISSRLYIRLRKLFTRWSSTFKHRLINELTWMLMFWKLTKSSTGRTK